MITTYGMTWQEFKENRAQFESDPSAIYRGHSSEHHKLTSTLSRFVSKKKIDTMPADEYYSALKKAHNEIKKTMSHNADEIWQAPLPDQNPIVWMLMTAGEGTQHHLKMRDTINTMRIFRHFGFPSPLLDWTRDIDIALFFAASNIESNDNMAIYRLRRFPHQKRFKLGYEYDIFAIDLSSTPGCSRDIRQKSVYTIAMRQDLLHTYPPHFYLPSYDNINFQAMQIDNVGIDKYIITDSAEKRLEILNELDDQGLSFEAIYEKTHPLENTILKDLALKLFFFPEKPNSTTIRTISEFERLKINQQQQKNKDNSTHYAS